MRLYFKNLYDTAGRKRSEPTVKETGQKTHTPPFAMKQMLRPHSCVIFSPIQSLVTDTNQQTTQNSCGILSFSQALRMPVRITFGYILSFFTLMIIALCDLWFQLFTADVAYKITLLAVGVVAVGSTGGGV